MKKERMVILLGSISLLLLLAALLIMSACAKAPQTAGPPVSTKGYSIFDETMVDMAWPAIEDAAKKGAIILFPTGVIEEHGTTLRLGHWYDECFPRFIRNQTGEHENRPLRCLFLSQEMGLQ